MRNRVEDVYIRKITDSKGRLNGRKASHEGKENRRLFQHSKGEGVRAWKKAGETVGMEPGERFREQGARLT